jgi:two-component system nitrogen regulation response regulator GlnG
VLIGGETGTGKELVARVICQHSQRSARPFMALNCAALPEGLLESELFGHERGAFTGADRRRIGTFEQCSAGTLFLDEIGEMPLPLQSKILRALQEQQVQRVGGNETIPIDVRVLAATNRNLEKAVAEGQFRADLYYRLNVYSIHLPPLRERREDLPRLIDRLLTQLAGELGKPVRRLAPDVASILASYSWPGNVRELQSVLKQAILQASGPLLLPEHLPAYLCAGAAPPPPVSMPSTSDGIDWDKFVADRLGSRARALYAQALASMERGLIAAVLGHTLGNQTAAADILGITRGSLRNKIRALGIDVGEAARARAGRLSPMQ